MTQTKSENVRRRTLADFFQGDKVIWIIFFLLCSISLVEVYSAASNLSYKTGNYWDPVVDHGLFLLVGTLLVLCVHNIPCRWFKFYPILMAPLSFIMLASLLLFGRTVNGAARWIPLFGFAIQPSEIAKGAVVIGAALILSAMQTDKGTDKHAMKYILYVSIPICLMIFPENFSTAAFLFLVVILMMFIGRVPMMQMGKLLGVLALFAASGFLFICYTPQNTLKKIPVLKRLSVWQLRLNEYTSEDHRKVLTPKEFDIANNAQKAHANIAIATSSVVGKFPGNSVERDFLSQAFSDFIYAIIIEEMGLVGGGFVLFLYIILLFRSSRIANQCERNFPAFLVLGLSLLLVTQAIINMAVAVGLFPVTGQPLPLISRGGSSTLINCIYIGMILSVSRFAKKRMTEMNAPVSPSRARAQAEPAEDDEY